MSKTNVKMEFTGWDDLAHELRDMVGGRYIGAVRNGLVEAAKPVEEEARRLVRIRSGTVFRAIYTSRVVVHSIASKEGYAYIKISVRRFQGAGGAIPLEYGHVNPDGSFTPPYSFMLPAYETKKEEAYEILRDKIRDAIIQA